MRCEELSPDGKIVPGAAADSKGVAAVPGAAAPTGAKIELTSTEENIAERSCGGVLRGNLSSQFL